MFNGHRISAWEDENVMGTDGGGDHHCDITTTVVQPDMGGLQGKWAEGVILVLKD